MKKLANKLRKFRKDPAKDVPDPWRQDEVLDPKFIVLNAPNPSPSLAPHPGTNSKGLRSNSNVQPEDDIGTFNGFGSWLASFEPDPNARGVVEVAAQPVHPLTAVAEVLSLEEGWPPECMIRLTLDGLKKPGSSLRLAVLIRGPWFMTLAQVNRLLAKHGYLEVLSAKNGTWAARSWDGDKALPSNLQIPVVDGPSRYDTTTGEGPLMSRNEQFGTFVQNLRRLRVRCQDGKVIATSFPAELEITFNRTLRLPEDGKTHNQPVRLGKVSVSNIAGISKKLEASRNQSLIDMARKGGVFFPLYQREAMFLSFKAHQDAFAIRVFVGGVNAVSGLPWNSPPDYKVATQDYLSIPPQQYLDGVCVGKDVVKQFVAMPLGSGYSVEKQVTGKETVGGMQLEIIPGDRWVLQLPASPNLSQAGPYFPRPHQTPGDLGAQIVVLDENPNVVVPETQKYDPGGEDELADNIHRPVYLRHLYQSQVQYPYPHQSCGDASSPTDFYPGMDIRMTAVYMLRLTLQYRDSNPGEDRTENVEWAPWWTLERCFSEHQKVAPKAGVKNLSDLELYHQGRRLRTGASTLQEQGLADGDLVVVQQPVPTYGPTPDHSYGGQYSSYTNPYQQPQSQQGSVQQQAYGYQYQGQTQGVQVVEPIYQNDISSQNSTCVSQGHPYLVDSLSPYPHGLCESEADLPARIRSAEDADRFRYGVNSPNRASDKATRPILADPFGPNTWCKGRATILSVQILNSVAFESLTGMLAPPSPITPQMYLKQGLPFLASYEEGVATDGAAYLAGIKGVGDLDAAGDVIQLGSNIASANNVGCTCCGKMLCDSILRPCNHAFCSSCIKGYMTHSYGTNLYSTICRICNTRATKLIGFSAPMALPGDDVVDLSDAKIITLQPHQGASGFHSVYELNAEPDEDNS
ncbi:RING-type domain-containing protein [Madurella fahalii]|uniref:RING-type domain-containing protein n=1 Tax=Madurella fahalii TaxID=1157608 RepID=A0ABQ0GFN3_9PEZI